MNLYDVFRETVERQPDAAAVLGPAPADRMTYRQLDDAVRRAADALARAGARPGACVGLHVPSGRDYVVMNYAVWKCGGCVVPVPVELSESEKREICQEIALDFVVSRQESPGFAGPLQTGGQPTELGCGFVAAALQPVRERPAGFQEIHSAFIRFTSGTTGTSKGVVLSHETIRDRIDAANEVLGIGPGDRVLWLLSMSYHFAVSIVAYLSFGAAVVLPMNQLAPAAADALRRHRGTLIYGSPAHYAWLAALAPDGPFGDLRLAVSTTASLEEKAAQSFHRHFGVPVSQALGLIEIGLPCVNVGFAADRYESVGRVLPAYRLRLFDIGLGASIGEVAFAGKGLLDAYYEPWRTRAEIMPDGWFRTGDVGELDADGCLFLRGRSKDVINVMGMKVFPAEVESVLRGHPRVREACVFAQRHARLGEVPRAQVVADDVADGDLGEELLRLCRDRLADYKVPDAIEFVGELRRTASGKLLRRRDSNGPIAESTIAAHAR